VKRTITVNVADFDAYADVVELLLKFGHTYPDRLERVSWTRSEEIKSILEQRGETTEWRPGSVHD
jgi:hypothetical protein